MECEKLPTCIFFNDQMDSMPAVADLLKSRYCRGAFAECEAGRCPISLGLPRGHLADPSHSWDLRYSWKGVGPDRVASEAT
jgi:hypothetical protein